MVGKVWGREQEAAGLIASTSGNTPNARHKAWPSFTCKGLGRVSRGQGRQLAGLMDASERCSTWIRSSLYTSYTSNFLTANRWPYKAVLWESPSRMWSFPAVLLLSLRDPLVSGSHSLELTGVATHWPWHFPPPPPPAPFQFWRLSSGACKTSSF